MGMPFIVEGPQVEWKRQAEFVLVGGNSETQILGKYTSKSWRMFWATEAEINAKVVEVQNDGWVLEGGPSLTPIYAPLDCYDATITAHKHTSYYGP